MNDRQKQLKREFYRSIFAIRRLSYQVMERFVLEEDHGIPIDLECMETRIREATDTYKAMITTYDTAEENKQEPDVHTEHCCKLCGCKYGDDLKDDDGYIGCSVVSGRKKQSYSCGGGNCRF